MRTESVLCLVAPLLSAAGAVEVEELREPDPEQRWANNGFVTMTPPIQLPTSREHDDVIKVWLRLPDGAEVDARWLGDQERWTLILPPGTEAERAEYFTGEAPDGTAGMSVADVRGTRIEQAGDEIAYLDRVLRPQSGALHAPLVGWTWRRGDDDAHAEATERLLDHARSTPRPLGRGPESEEGLEMLARLNACGECHSPDRPPQLKGQARRATDARGFIVPLSVLQEECVVAAHRPEDLNAEDPFVRVHCGTADGPLAQADGESFHCDDGQVPVGVRDVAGGMAASDPYTEKVCESRRYLHVHMTQRAREAFASAFRDCGIGEDSPQ